MRKSEVNYWYVADGDGRRSYSDVFLRFGVMLIGPGDLGGYFENRRAYRGHYYVPRFANEVKPGDTIILKQGVKDIVAVGTVDERKDSYGHFNVFSDVKGFSIQHARFVTWHKASSKYSIPKLPRDRLCQCQDPKVQEIARNVIKEAKCEPREEIPPEAEKVNDEELIRHLIEHGLSSGQAEDVVRAFQRVRRLGKWYEAHWEEQDISEHETRTFLIVPLLLALGWPEQRLKIEWASTREKLDIAFFKSNYRHGKKPIMILESKRFDEPLSYASSQVKRYAKKFPNCTRLFVSNGIRYLSFRKVKNEWKPTAYLNMLELLDRHPYLTDVKGAPQLLTQLLS